MSKGLLRIGAALLAAGCLFATATRAAAPGAWPHGWALEGSKIFLHLPSLDTAGVRSIAQDRQGFLWLGSDSGLLRWDGYRLHSYAQDPGTPGALPDNYVRVVYIDERERLWVGTNAGGLSRYDAEQDAFVSVPVGAGGTRDGNVAALISDGHGGLWIGTGRGLDHLDGETGRVDPPAPGLPAGQVSALLLDRQGALWVGTRGGLLRRPAGAASFEPAPWPASARPAVTALAQDLAGRVWVGTALHGAYVYEVGASLPRPLLENEGVPRPLGDTITTVREVGSGEVWLGTDNSGILRVDTTTWRTRRELHDDTRSTSLADNGIHNLFMDRGGLLWVASSVALSRIDPQERMIQTFFGGSGAGRLFADANISTLLALPDGRIWVGLGDGGVDLLDPVQGRIGGLRPGRGQRDDALPKSKVEAMAGAPDGSVFLGTAAGLFLASADGRLVRRVTLPGHKDLLEVHCLRFADHRLWLGATDGLWELELQDGGSLRPLQHFDKELGDARIASMAPGRDGTLWIGTQTGLARIDLASGKATRLPADPRDKSALPGGFVSSLLTDQDGRLWVATYGQGIQIEQKPRADGRPNFLRLSQRDGLPQNSVDSLQLDAKGNVWVSTDDGLARIDPATLRIHVYRAAQGVGVGAFWAGAGTTTPPGDLLFGGLTGMVVVHPELEVPEEPAAPMAATEIHVGGQPVAAAQALAHGGLHLGAHERNLEIEFAALDYADPEHRRYAYQLEGFDTDWMETPATRRLAAYTNLPPGEYHLLLRSARADGPWSEPYRIPVQVQAAWYQHDLVRLLGSVLVAACIIGLVQLRTLVLRRRQGELERLVAERTAALQHSQQQLEQMAYFDMLTGLPNRRMFNEHLRRLIAGQSRGQGGFTLLLIDLDGFKPVNDTLGHAVGDALLVAIADQLRQLVRESDLAARLGGDEFAILLTNTMDIAAIESTCARIVTKIGEPLVVSGHSVRVGASIGIVPCPARGASADELYRAADSALYQAKQAGRSTWRWGTAESYSFSFG